MYNQDDETFKKKMKEYEREKAMDIGLWRMAEIKREEETERQLARERGGEASEALDSITDSDDWDITYLADAHAERRRRMQADMDANLFEDWTEGPAEGWKWVKELDVDPETVCDPQNKDLLLEATDEIARLTATNEAMASQLSNTKCVADTYLQKCIRLEAYIRKLEIDLGIRQVD